MTSKQRSHQKEIRKKSWSNSGNEHFVLLVLVVEPYVLELYYFKWLLVYLTFLCGCLSVLLSVCVSVMGISLLAIAYISQFQTAGCKIVSIYVQYSSLDWYAN